MLQLFFLRSLNLRLNGVSLKIMSGSRIRTDFKFLIFNELSSADWSPKARRVAFGHMEATIQCLARKTFDSVTLNDIAREAGVTRQALRRYFNDSEELKTLSMKYIRLLFQKLVLEAVSQETDARSMLSVYVASHFRWLESQKTHMVVWFLFMQRCFHKKKFRELNTAAVHAGTDRITSLLERGVEQGVFQCEHPEVTARTIQLVITGALVSAISENISKPAVFSNYVEQQCLALAGAISSAAAPSRTSMS